MIKEDENSVVVKDFLLRCRVLFRKIEDYIIYELSRNYNSKKIIIEFRETALNNKLVPNFLKSSYFNLLNNRVQTEQFIVNVVPDYITLTYSWTIQTYYVEQLNKIIEVVNYASDSYWGDPERFKFKASIDSYSTTVEITDNTNRIVKGTFSIKLFGYVVPDTIQKELTAIKKYNSKSQVIISAETVTNINNT